MTFYQTQAISIHLNLDLSLRDTSLIRGNFREIIRVKASRPLVSIFLVSIAHINSVCKTSFWHLRNIWRIRTYLDKSSLEILIHAFTTNKLDYCNSLLTGLLKYLIKRLQSVQNAAARLVSGSKKHDHITPVLQDLHWLPVEKRITYKTLLITFKCLNNLAPSYLSDLIIQYKPTGTLRSSSQNLLVIPRTNTIRYGERAFLCCST